MHRPMWEMQLVQVVAVVMKKKEKKKKRGNIEQGPQKDNKWTPTCNRQVKICGDAGQNSDKCGKFRFSTVLCIKRG